MSEPPFVLSRVRVLIVDDSAFMRASLTRMVASEPDFEVVGTAPNGTIALEKIESLDPEVVTLDVMMPGLDGLATLRCIMSRFPRPVIMVSASTEKNAEPTLDALSAGAFGCVHKQMSATSLDISHIRSDLISKIRAAARSRRSSLTDGIARKPPSSVRSASPSSGPAVVAIGASTGGPGALEEILPHLPHDFSLPVVIVQHMPPGYTAPFAARLNRMCAIPVREASQSEELRPGVVYIAPSGRHMRIVRLPSSQLVMYLDSHPENAPHIPSIDVLMKSVADCFGARSMGVILTGMGNDGADGMAAIFRLGGITIGQDEGTCTVYGMPRVCAERGILSRVVPLSEIASQILHFTRHSMRAAVHQT
jgi:two-component system, chemotaxis family, protein-glutamate methylesterase/glutaminase